MVSAPHHRFDFAEYVEIEAASGIKHEFLDGQVLAMSGGTPEHAAVTANVVRAERSRSIRATRKKRQLRTQS